MQVRHIAFSQNVYHGPMSLRETLERVCSSPDPQNEESAKFQVIAPILQALGWDTSNGEQALFEYSVGGKKGGRVDIALKLIGFDRRCRKSGNECCKRPMKSCWS